MRQCSVECSEIIYTVDPPNSGKPLDIEHKLNRMSESWLKPNISDETIKIETFKPAFRTDMIDCMAWMQ